MKSDVIVVMGVAGAGKTLIGSLLSQRLGGAFADADSFHNQSNKTKMAAGMPLSDQDRQPWLEAMHKAIQSWIADGGVHVLACSALKDSYRHILQCGSPHVRFVYLKLGKDLAEERLKTRHGHFMKSNMIDSQFAALEEPDEEIALTIDAGQDPAKIVNEICNRLNLVG